MTEFSISIAGIPIKICALYPSTKDYCLQYLTDETPALTIVSDQKLIQREQELSNRQDRAEAKSVHAYSPSYLELLAVYREIAEQLIEQNILLFHGSAVAVDGQVYLFTAKSRTGKSTHVQLWCQMLGERAVVVNDDKPLLKVQDNGVLVCGTPWNGKHRRGANLILPLKAICQLERAETNSIQPWSAWDAFPKLMQQCYRSLDPMRLPKALDLLEQIALHVPLYRMHCNNLKGNAAEISFEMMSKGEKKQ